MRIEFKENITNKIHQLYHELQTINKFHLVEAIYLSNSEWDELRYYLGFGFNLKRVAIHQPLRISYDYRYDTVISNPTIIQTEEIEYHGFKVRREYK